MEKPWSKRNADAILECVRILLAVCPEAATKSYDNGLLPLHVACKRLGHGQAAADALKLLLQANPAAAFEERDSDCTEPEWLATHYCHYGRGARRFDESEAPTFNSKGWLPLHFAAYGGGPKGRDSAVSMRVLLEANPAAARAVTPLGHPPLHLATISYRDGRVMEAHMKELLKVYPKAARKTDFVGNTPLHLLCISYEMATLPVARLVVSAYPRALKKKNAYGLTPLDGLESKDRTELQYQLIANFHSWMDRKFGTRGGAGGWSVAGRPGSDWE